MITAEQLKDDLLNSGLKPTDTVLIHSSMKSIGDVAGGADTVLDVLEDTFCQDGLLAFPTLTWKIGYDLCPEAGTVFSVRDSPTDVGILAELFRHRPGVIRSLHPTHSVAAKGPRARDFTALQENATTTLNWDSPWGKLYDWKAKILFIGCGIGCNTFLHAVEEKFPVPGLLASTPKHLTVIDWDGRQIPMDIRRHTGAHSQFYNLMELPFLMAGACTKITFGNAQCHLLDARMAADLTWQVLQKFPTFFSPEYHARSLPATTQNG